MARREKVTHGQPFRTRNGRWGCYKYVNGKRVAFVKVKKNYFPRRTGQTILPIRNRRQY